MLKSSIVTYISISLLIFDPSQRRKLISPAFRFMDTSES